MSDHALIAPSSAAAIVACPARVLMSYGAGDHMEGDRTAAMEGTAAHEVAETWASNQQTMLDVGTATSNGVAVTQHMQESAATWRKLLESWGMPYYVERRLPVPQVPRCFGTSDGSAAAYRHIRIADYKYGYKPIEPDSLQLACYAGAVAADSGTPLDADTRVDMTIYQPRAWHRNGPIRTATLRGDQVAAMLATLAEAAYQALAPEPIAKPGPHCATCKGRVRCTALRNEVLQYELAVLPDDLPMQHAERELQYLERKKTLTDAYVSGLQLDIEHRMRNGERATLYELRRKTGSLVWRPGVEAEMRTIARLMGHNVDAPQSLITPTQAKALLGPAVDVYALREPAAVRLAPLTPADKLFRS